MSDWRLRCFQCGAYYEVSEARFRQEHGRLILPGLAFMEAPCEACSPAPAAPTTEERLAALEARVEQLDRALSELLAEKYDLPVDEPVEPLGRSFDAWMTANHARTLEAIARAEMQDYRAGVAERDAVAERFLEEQATIARVEIGADTAALREALLEVMSILRSFDMARWGYTSCGAGLGPLGVAEDVTAGAIELSLAVGSLLYLVMIVRAGRVEIRLERDIEF